MSKVKFGKGVLLTSLISGVAAMGVWAQPPDKTKPSQDVTDKVRKVTPEMKDVYKKWMNTDVAYIITSDEKKAFKALVTDEERENFIENFWRRRDPNPDTEENEYREEYYERIAYANEHFASGIPRMENRPRPCLYRMGQAGTPIESRPSGGV
ncbi:MAG: GWxTD domain-containing protein [Acidobacteria bacterium]|nr:GWxTD domain-containing protein [Acidobacteriota bacterium]